MYTTIEEKEAYYTKIKEKRKANKEYLLDQTIDMLWENPYEYKEFIKDLLHEALNKRTQKELKQIIYGT